MCRDLRLQTVKDHVVRPDGFFWTKCNRLGRGEMRDDIEPGLNRDFGSRARITEQSGNQRIPVGPVVRECGNVPIQVGLRRASEILANTELNPN